MTREEQIMFKEMQETNSFLRASLSIQAEQMKVQSQQISDLLEHNQQQAERIEELLQKIDELSSKGNAFCPSIEYAQSV